MESVLRGEARGPGGAGYVQLVIGLAGDRIAAVDWESNGCPAAHKAAGGLALFLKGRTVEQASRIEPSDLLVLIGGLPDGKGHYADIAVGALQAALKSSDRIDSSCAQQEHEQPETEN